MGSDADTGFILHGKHLMLLAWNLVVALHSKTSSSSSSFYLPIIQQFAHLHQYSWEEQDSKVRHEHQLKILTSIFVGGATLEIESDKLILHFTRYCSSVAVTFSSKCTCRGSRGLLDDADCIFRILGKLRMLGGDFKLLRNPRTTICTILLSVILWSQASAVTHRLSSRSSDLSPQDNNR